ncbi:helix-turn-helix domain-containing protein [Anaeromyxobacter oryzisoli]|uniref:helix-turn-helix domain-containing protein n=1 Tax=Anaeromyxobacter oryzisoli TaxID=2925408 RepID=UPI0038CC0F25
MNTYGTSEHLTGTPTYSERRVGRNDRRTGGTPPQARREPGIAAVDTTENSNAGRQAKARPPLSDDRSWGVQEVAYFLNVSESTIRNLERDGELPALPRIGTRIIFDPKVVRAFRDGWRPPPRGRAPGRPDISIRSDPRVQR